MNQSPWFSRVMNFCRSNRTPSTDAHTAPNQMAIPMRSILPDFPVSCIRIGSSRRVSWIDPIPKIMAPRNDNQTASRSPGPPFVGKLLFPSSATPRRTIGAVTANNQIRIPSPTARSACATRFACSGRASACDGISSVSTRVCITSVPHSGHRLVTGNPRKTYVHPIQRKSCVTALRVTDMVRAYQRILYRISPQKDNIASV